MLAISHPLRACLAIVIGLGVACGSTHDNLSEAPTTGGAGSSNAGAGGASAGRGSGGSANATGGTVGGTTGGARAVSGGASSTSSGGATVPSAGRPAAQVPPPARADGNSPYLTACHGDTTSCVDIANLLCLGIRDGSEVAGYSCSNPCEDDADCSSASTMAEAQAACVDFVTQKHCLLVCLDNGVKSACPSGMICYNYPGNPLGYCLWK